VTDPTRQKDAGTGRWTTLVNRLGLSVLAYSVVVMDDVAALERMAELQRSIAST
jgi:hypothetical protein